MEVYTEQFVPLYVAGCPSAPPPLILIVSLDAAAYAVKRNHNFIIAIDCMYMRLVMSAAYFALHPDDNPIKHTQRRHNYPLIK